MYVTATIIIVFIAFGALLVDTVRRLLGQRDEEHEAAHRPPNRASFWRRVSVEMERAEFTTRYGDLSQSLHGRPLAYVLCAMPLVTWAIYAAVPELPAVVLYAVFVLIGAALGSYAFRPQPNRDAHFLVLSLMTAVLLWGFVNGDERFLVVGQAVGYMAAAILFFHALAGSRKQAASRWSRPAPQRKPVAMTKPEEVMALVSIGLQLVVFGLVLTGWIPNLRPVAWLPLVGLVPWLLSYLMARGRGYQAPPWRAPGLLLPIAPVAWLLRTMFGFLAHLLMPAPAAGAKPAEPEPEPEGGLGSLLLFLAARVTPVLLLCCGQMLLWKAAEAVRAQAVWPIHLYLMGAIAFYCLAAAPTGLEVKAMSWRKATSGLGDHLIGQGLVTARALARNFSVLSLLALPMLASSVLSGAWRQSLWPLAYVVAIVTGMAAMRTEKPAEMPTPETKAFRAAGGR